ncbi:polysaccharide pyruvyl transferase family protein [Arthrobacter cavernae]|uniref:Polysaccharide pyruvyl transferase family protein n=1 Tax=Arthrobacter cavernae TaxID=2817681 RepID=A0A939KL46_9MICC|nr:polysaccharide pyruvyl transferase family protein [Arthrobacter cavernae]MBO1266863.1 polysaccharide pyruvyl transferase family protein [Arthrobacter cavernae]
MRVVILADIGQPVYHVGDEAMAHAAVLELASRGVEDVVLLSRDAGDSKKRFSTGAVPTLQFPWPPLERERHLQDVTRALHGDRTALPPEDPAWEVFSTIASSDGVLIAGGGNLNSVYGWLLYERAAVARIAAYYGKPLVVSGQTLGPALVGPDGCVLQEMLTAAELVGTREAGSFELASGWALEDGRLVAGLDDASFLASSAAPAGEQIQQEPYIVATFGPGTGGLDQKTFYGQVAAILDDVVAFTGLKVLLAPHMGTPDQCDADVESHENIRSLTSSGMVECLPIQGAAETARLTASADLVLSSRYHPLVFAIDGCTPVVGLSVDDYSDVRLKGVMVNWGLEDLSLTLPSLLSGDYLSAVRDAWSRRGDIQAHLAAHRGMRVEEAAVWWDAVVGVFAGDDPGLVRGLNPAPPLKLTRPSAAETELPRRLFNSLTAQISVSRLELERLRGELDLCRSGAETARTELSSIRSSRSFRLARKLAGIAAKIRPRRQP